MYNTQKTDYVKENNPNWRGGKEIECANCSAKIWRYPSQIKRAKNIFCSDKCHDLFRVKPKPEKAEHGPRWTGDKLCRGCENLLVERADRRRGTCQECKKISSKVGGAKRGQIQTIPEKFYCVVCSKELVGKSRTKRKVCNKTCEAKYRTEFLSRGNSKLWRGGSSYTNYPPEFNNDLRAKIRNRDNNTCQDCGVKEDSLDVHHKNANKHDNSQENLVALCRSCHGKADWKLRNGFKNLVNSNLG